MNTWILQGACLNVDPDLFFPDVESDDAYAAGATYCRACPVAEPCLAAALQREVGKRATNRSGLFGGLNPRQRGELANDLDHGTYICYVSDLCRCAACRAAATEAKQARRKTPAAA